MSYTIKRLERIEKAIIASKPKMVDGKAMYIGQHYTSLDDAWDWFENDLQAIKDIRKGDSQYLMQEVEEEVFCNGQDEFYEIWDFASGSKEERLCKDLREQGFTWHQLHQMFLCMTEFAVERDAFNVLEEKDYEETA